MAIKIGTRTPSDIYVGTHKVAAVYAGSTRIYPAAVLENVVLHVTGSGDTILADGSNYAYITATYRDGSTTLPVTLAPVVSSGSFYVSGTNIKGYDRGVIPGNAIHGTVYGTYNGIRSEDLEIVQEANVETTTPAYDVTTAYSISISDYTSPFPLAGGTKTLSGTRTYTHHNTRYDYTSGAHIGGEVTTGLTQSALPSSVTISPSGGLTYLNGTLTASDNRHSADSRSWGVTGTYDGVTSSAVYTGQPADSYNDEHNARDYYAVLTKGDGSITAAGGRQMLVISAGHTDTVYRVWASDGYRELISSGQVEDHPTPVESGDTYNGFSFADGWVNHLTMADNSRLGKQGQSASESAEYYVVNGGVESNHVTFSATNGRTMIEDAYTETTGFEMSLSKTEVTEDAGSIEANSRRIYKSVTARYGYDSGAEEGGIVTEGLRQSVSSSATLVAEPTTGITISRPVIYYTANTGETSRSWKITSMWADESQTLWRAEQTFSQRGVAVLVAMETEALSSTRLLFYVRNLDTVQHDIYWKIVWGGGYEPSTGTASAVAAGARRQVAETNPQQRPPISTQVSLDPIE